MKLLLVSEFFYPYKTSTQKILTELSEDLVELGIEVNVITTKNAYREEKQKLKSYEEYKGIKIKRLLSTSLNRDSKFGRLMNYGTFISSVFFNLLFRTDYDKILFVSNPPLVPYIGYLMKKIKKKNYIYLVHDIYPDVAEKLGVISKGSFISKMMDSINNKIYKNSEKIIVLGKDMKTVIENKGVNPNKIEIITNWADSNNTFVKPKNIECLLTYGMKNKFNIVYTGNISKVHAIDSILEIAKYFKNDDEIMFTFVGDGNRKEYIKEFKHGNKLENIQILDYMFGEKYNDMLNCADVFIATLQEGIEGLGVPSKTYTYMSVEKPIIAIMSKESEVGNMVRVNNLGGQFLGSDIDGIIHFIKKIKSDKELYNEISMNVKEIFEEKYERKKVTKLFCESII